MTLVAALEIHGTPVMLSDLMVTRGQEQTTRKKMVRLRSNLAIGWSDTLIAAKVMLRELDERLPDRVTIDDVGKVLQTSAHEIGALGLQLIGWVLSDRSTAFSWSSDRPQDLFTGSTFTIGSGTPWLSTFMQGRNISGPPPKISTTFEQVNFQALVIAGNLMKSELSTRESRSLGFGFGYEVLVAHGDRFNYITPVVYAATRANVDAAGVVRSPFTATGTALIRNVGEFTICQSALFSDDVLDVDLVSPPIPCHSEHSNRRIERAAIDREEPHVFDGRYCVHFTQLYEDGEKPWPPLVGVVPRTSSIWRDSSHRGVTLAMDPVIKAAAEMGKRRKGRW